MNVLFVHPRATRPSFQGFFSTPEPLGALYLASALQREHSVRLVDLRITPDLDGELAGFAPDVAFVGVGPLLAGGAERALAELRRRFHRAVLVLHAEAEYGNSHVAERPRDFALDGADALVRTFYLATQQRVARRVVEALARGGSLAGVAGLLVRDEPGRWRETAPEPDSLGPVGAADRALLGRARGRYRFAGIGRMAHVFYTYGCRFKCRFCPMSKHDGSLSARPIDEVMAELTALTEPHVYLEDFEPFLMPEAMSALADAVERAGVRKKWYALIRADTALEQRELIARWKRLGLRWIYLGLDGHDDERLQEIKKGTTTQVNARAVRAMRELGLAVTVGFVARSDFTRADFRAVRAAAFRSGADLVGFTVETPLVGTRLFDQSETSVTSRDWSLFDLEHALLPTRLSLEEFYGELALSTFLGGLRSLPGMLRHYPLRDFARSSLFGWRALGAIARAARDHAPGPAAIAPSTATALESHQHAQDARLA
jgi:magnesium-protoporphyrin IX monomethyl ester (oxidative) cyclase